MEIYNLDDPPALFLQNVNHPFVFSLLFRDWSYESLPQQTSMDEEVEVRNVLYGSGSRESEDMKRLDHPPALSLRNVNHPSAFSLLFRDWSYECLPPPRVPFMIQECSL